MLMSLFYYKKFRTLFTYQSQLFIILNSNKLVLVSFISDILTSYTLVIYIKLSDIFMLANQLIESNQSEKLF